MPRFNSDRYNTAQDSSPGWKSYKPEFVVLLMASKYHPSEAVTPVFGCPCGCGGWPLGEKAKFAMGHDARLRGILIRAHLMGKSILYVVRNPEGAASDMPPLSAEKIAIKYGWKKYLDAAVLRREGKDREVLARAIGSTRLLQVGRSSATGRVVAVYRDERRTDMCEIEYVNGAGDVKRARMPIEETTPV